MYRPARQLTGSDDSQNHKGGGVNRKDSVRIGPRVVATSGLKFPNITHVIRDISPHKRESCIGQLGSSHAQTTRQNHRGGGVNRKDSVRIGPRVMATCGLKFPNITYVRRDISPHKRESCIGQLGSSHACLLYTSDAADE